MNSFGGTDSGWGSTAPTLKTKVSSPTNVQHITRTTNVGEVKIILPGTFLFSSKSKNQLCTLTGAMLSIVPIKTKDATKHTGIHNLLECEKIYFKYDHTVKETSHKRNRIILVKQHNINMFDVEIIRIVLSIPTDKEIARWEAFLRAIPKLRTRCYSTLCDVKGRVRPYLYGMHAEYGGKGGYNDDGGGSGGGGTTMITTTATVRTVRVHLPESLGTLTIRLKKSSLVTTALDIKVIVFERLVSMKERLKIEGGLEEEESETNQSNNIGNVGSIEREEVLEEKGERTLTKSAHVSLQREQFMNPLAALDQMQIVRKDSGVDSRRLPNQVMNPFAQFEEQTDVQSTTTAMTATTATTATHTTTPTTPTTLTPTTLLPSQILARTEYDSVCDLLFRGMKAFILRRPPRSDNPGEQDKWAFDEEGITIESLGVTNDGILSIELRDTNEMSSSGLECHVLALDMKDVFGKLTPHYKMFISHIDIKWNIKIKYNKINKFAKDLWSYWNNELNNDEKQKYCHVAIQSGSGTINGEPMKTPKNDTVDAIQIYMNSILRHPWSSSSAILFEFLGAASTSRNDARNTVLHISQLKEYVRPGDIILFKCSDRWNVLTRLTLNANFDHVGIVVETTNGMIKLLESTGEGVQTYPLVGRLRGYYLADYVESICVRRISKTKVKKEENIFQEEEELDEEETKGKRNGIAVGAKFVKKVVGKPYQLRHVVTQGLSRKRGSSTSKKSTNSDGKEQKGKKKERRKSTAVSGTQKGYFCSEVCAAYLKCLNILPDQEAHCAAYWPSSFDLGGEIEQDIQRQGYYMEDLIELDLKILELGKAKSKRMIEDEDLQSF